MIKLMDLLNEGVHDKGIFKAVFMAGGPGSGKSFVAKSLYGIPDNIHISIKGMKMVNQDKEFKYLLKKYGFDPAWLDKYPEGTFDEPGGLRQFAKELNTVRKEGYMKGKLGMIIDGTGHSYKKIKAEKELLEKEGYDTYMVFVMTTLEVAQARNKERDRVLPEKIVTRSWNDTRKNLGAYKSTFGGKFAFVDNSKTLDAKAARHKFIPLVKNYVNKWASEPIKNPVGQKWVKDQMKLQKLGIKK